MPTKAELVKILENFSDNDEVVFNVERKEEYGIKIVVPEKPAAVNEDSAPTEVIDAPVVEEKAVEDEIAD